MNRDFFYPVLRVNSLLDSFDLIESERGRPNRMEAEAKFIRALFWGASRCLPSLTVHRGQQPPRHPLPRTSETPLPSRLCGERTPRSKQTSTTPSPTCPTTTASTRQGCREGFAGPGALPENDFEGCALATESLKATGIRWSSQTRTAPSCGCVAHWHHKLRVHLLGLQHLPPTTTAQTNSCSGGNPPPIRRSP